MFNLTLSPPAILNKIVQDTGIMGNGDFAGKNGVAGFEMKLAQGAKKIIFIAFHSGKLKLQPVAKVLKTLYRILA